VVLKPVVERYRGKVSRIYFRADTGFTNPEVYEFLEGEQIKYAILLLKTASCRGGTDICSIGQSACPMTCTDPM
jgi:hypothetical protein